MQKVFCLFLCGLLGMGFPQGSLGGEASWMEGVSDVDVAQIIQDITVLSSPDFQGRQAGTEGGRQSAAYVAKRFINIGLMPPESKSHHSNLDSWYQQTVIPVTTIPGKARLEISVSSSQPHALFEDLKPGSDFLPLLDSPSVHMEAPMVFVGYGISDPARGVDEYEGIDVRNRVAMFLRGKPSTYPQWVTHEEKVRVAQQKGAIGFLTATGPILNAYEARRGMGHAPLALYSFPPHARPLPGVWVSGGVAEKIFTSMGESLSTIQAQLNMPGSHQSRTLPVLVGLNWEREDQTGSMVNVLGWLPGQDPVLREETIVLGAHRDHFGHQAGLLFTGADDNASGTAVLLEIARILKTMRSQLKRSVLLISFSGEERGLLGSKHYIKHPTRSLKKTVGMINSDHVGVGNGKLTVGVSLLPKSVGKRAAELVGLQEQVTLYGFFPGGDHVPFKEASIPTIVVVSSGKHTSFHQSHDTTEKIQPEILEAAAKYGLALTLLLSNSP